MTACRTAFWDAEKRAAYLDRAAEKAKASQRSVDGDTVAEALDSIWADLDAAEMALLEALLRAEQRSFVAAHDHPDLRGLVARGLLAYPRGHGGNWMRAAKTSYSVPTAVWARLQQLDRLANGPGRPNDRVARGAAKVLLARLINGEPWRG